jgi:hypothetical protein
MTGLENGFRGCPSRALNPYLAKTFCPWESGIMGIFGYIGFVQLNYGMFNKRSVKLHHFPLAFDTQRKTPYISPHKKG